MSRTSGHTISVIIIWGLLTVAAFPHSGLDFTSNRTRRDVSCSEEEYLDNICCLKCPAGKYVTSPCSTPGNRGTCVECEDGTFMEHANGLRKCFKCTPCHDKETVRPCSHTQDTICQCKAGQFCDPDEACETCKKCARCGKDEIVVRNCTPTANTECKKTPLSPNPDTGRTTIVAVVSVLVVVTIAGVICYCCYKHKYGPASQGNRLKDTEHSTDDSRTTQTQRSSYLIWSKQVVSVKPSLATEDEQKGLCESLNSSASNSQHSLTNLPSSASPALQRRGSLPRPRPDMRDAEPFPNLVPVNGEDSLRGCFEYFEKFLDVNYQKRFFRKLGLSDNVIKSKDYLEYEDRIHELLNIWIEKVGRDASLNDLLKVLLELDQRLTAEMVKEKALEDCHYIVENK